MEDDIECYEQDKRAGLQDVVHRYAFEPADLDYAALKTILDAKGGTRASKDDAQRRIAVRRMVFKALPKSAHGYYLQDGRLLVLWEPAGVMRLRLD